MKIRFLLAISIIFTVIFGPASILSIVFSFIGGFPYALIPAIAYTLLVIFVWVVYIFYYFTINEDYISQNGLFRKKMVHKNNIIKINVVYNRNAFARSGKEIKYIIISYKENELIKYLKIYCDFYGSKKSMLALEKYGFEIESYY